jgi:hypothetical protein
MRMTRDLAGPDGQDAPGVDQAGVVEVVKTSLREDLRASFELDGFTKFDS